jgi:Heavy metal associated domain 2
MMLYIHHVPGRLRIQTARLKADWQLAQAACDRAIAIEGVVEVRANSLTGSLTIGYNREHLTPAALWEQLRERDLVSGPLPITNERGVTRAELTVPALGSGRGLFGLVAGVVLEKLLERSALALVSALI